MLEFPNYNVDVKVEKTDRLRPDIIVHKRHTNHNPQPPWHGWFEPFSPILGLGFKLALEEGATTPFGILSVDEAGMFLSPPIIFRQHLWRDRGRSDL